MIRMPCAVMRPRHARNLIIQQETTLWVLLRLDRSWRRSHGLEWPSVRGVGAKRLLPRGRCTARGLIEGFYFSAADFWLRGGYFPCFGVFRAGRVGGQCIAEYAGHAVTPG